MVKKSVGDLLSVGLILIGIFIFFISLRESSLIIKLVGAIGSAILIVVEIYFLGKKLRWL